VMERLWIVLLMLLPLLLGVAFDVVAVAAAANDGDDAVVAMGARLVSESPNPLSSEGGMRIASTIFSAVSAMVFGSLVCVENVVLLE